MNPENLHVSKTHKENTEIDDDHGHISKFAIPDR
jgi:hypothetical protein